LTGTVKNVNYERGFFFVSGDDGLDYFAHRSSLSDAALFDELQRGDSVLLVTTENGPKGWKATSVVPQATTVAPEPAG
jgi:cold shock CspA family protein